MYCIGIEDIPDDLKKCRKLVVLNLSVNPLSQFPDVITKLISLEELYLNDIQLDYLPANTCRLVNLRILELRENRLSNLPKAISRLNHLTRLDIGLNDFWDIVSFNFVLCVHAFNHICVHACIQCVSCINILLLSVTTEQIFLKFCRSGTLYLE